jgi:hypothetical protein
MVGTNFVNLTGKLIEDIAIVEGKYGKTYGVISLKVHHHRSEQAQSSISINRFDIFIWSEEALYDSRNFCKKGISVDVKGVLQNTQGIMTINVYEKDGIAKTKLLDQQATA